MGHAWAYARALTESPNARVVGVHDPEPEHTRWIAPGLRTCRSSTTPRRCSPTPEVEAVVVCSANADHRRARRARGRARQARAVREADRDHARGRRGDGRGLRRGRACSCTWPSCPGSCRSSPGPATAVRDGRLGELVGMVGGNRGRPPLPPAYPAWITDPRRGRWRRTDRPLGARHRRDAPRQWPRGDRGVRRGRLACCGTAASTTSRCCRLRFDERRRRQHRPELVGARRTTRGTTTSTCASSAPRARSTSPTPPRPCGLVSTAAGRPRGLRLASFAEDADRAMIEAFLASVRAGCGAGPVRHRRGRRASPRDRAGRLPVLGRRDRWPGSVEASGTGFFSSHSCSRSGACRKAWLIASYAGLGRSARSKASGRRWAAVLARAGPRRARCSGR